MHKKTYTQIVMNLLQPQYHKSLSHLELCIITNKSTHKIEVYGMSKAFPSLHSIEIATRSHVRDVTCQNIFSDSHNTL